MRCSEGNGIGERLGLAVLFTVIMMALVMMGFPYIYRQLTHLKSALGCIIAVSTDIVILFGAAVAVSLCLRLLKWAWDR